MAKQKKAAALILMQLFLLLALLKTNMTRQETWA